MLKWLKRLKRIAERVEVAEHIDSERVKHCKYSGKIVGVVMAEQRITVGLDNAHIAAEHFGADGIKLVGVAEPANIFDELVNIVASVCSYKI